jgi:hypothetical protein
MLSARSLLIIATSGLLASCQWLSPMEHKIVGAWSWTYIEGVGRMMFASDHTLRMGFPPDEKDGRKISDSEFEILKAGTWRVEGDVLITETDNKPLIELLQRIAPSEVPAFKKETQRLRIVSIDDNKIVFDNRSVLERVHR